MNYTEFEQYFLVAAYLLSEESGKEIIQVADILTHFDLEPKPNWIRRAISSYIDYGYAKGRMHMGAEREQHIFISSSGVKEAERLLETESMEPARTAPTSEDDTRTFPSVNSTSWTGRYTVSPEGQERVLTILRDIDTQIDRSNLSNVDRQNAKSLIAAAQELTGAPDPHWDIILNILASPILGNFAALAALIIAVVKP